MDGGEVSGATTGPSTQRPGGARARAPSPVRQLYFNSFLAAAACLLLTGASLVWNLAAVTEQTHTLAVWQARANFDKDVAFRLWATSHGGVYVPVTELTPPNPYLAHVPERDITTPSGRALTLLNPAYMLRQIMEFHAELYGITGHITSLAALNPANAPDPWEEEALRDFERGATERVGYAEIDGQRHLRLMRPLVAHTPCLKCHAAQGYREGDVRGAVGVAIPTAPLEAIGRDSRRKLVASHAVFGALTLLGVFLVFLRARVRLGDRLRSEASLLASEQRFRSTFEQAAVGVAHLAPDGSWLRVNQKLCDVLGYSRQELLATRLETLRHPDEAAAEVIRTRQLLAGEIPFYSTEGRLLRKGAEPVWVSLTTSLVRDAAGGARYLMVVVLDISERKHLESQLHQSQKMEALGTMAGGIAHDFNNILTPILGYTDLLVLRAQDEGQASPELDEIRKAADRARDLVRQILTFSRQREESRQPMVLHPVIKEALKLLRAVIPSSIEFKVEIDEHCGRVAANPTEIHQIIMNLCTNAYHAMRDRTGGVLSISLRSAELAPSDVRSKIELSPGRYVRLEVGDTGCGMSAAVRERIFEPYFTTKARGEGTGLGLSVVHGIVRKGGGAISVYSEPGRGSVFHVYLPVYPGDDATERPGTEALPPPVGTERVLVVDDEEQIAELLSAVLSGLGYRVSAVTDSLEALRRFKATPADFDLLVTDQTMPKMNGADLVREVLAIRPDVAVLLCTGFSEALNREQALALGIRDYLMKPLSARELAIAVRKALDDGAAPSTGA